MTTLHVHRVEPLARENGRTRRLTTEEQSAQRCAGYLNDLAPELATLTEPQLRILAHALPRERLAQLADTLARAAALRAQ
jgi:hypothetical protein